MPNLQLHHAGLRVSDLEAAEKFYGQTLGLKRLWDFVLERPLAKVILGVDAECRFVTYEAGAGRLEIISTGTEAVHPVPGQHVCLLVPERDRFLDRLRGLGVALREVSREGREVVFVADPDQNLIELKAEEL